MPDLTPPAVILDKPQMAENIGAVARVMANFGLSDLRLVSPRDGWPQERSVFIGSDDSFAVVVNGKIVFFSSSHASKG